MKCQICGQREAIAYIKRQVQHAVSEWFVCSECALEHGISSPFGAGHGATWNGFFSTPSLRGRQANNRCPMCGMSLHDIFRDGHIGCSECYITFYESLSPSLQRIHGNLKHNGKVPSCYRGEYNETSELKVLKEQLKQAVDAQEYERCAMLRDRIRTLEKEGEV